MKTITSLIYLNKSTKTVGTEKAGNPFSWPWLGWVLYHCETWQLLIRNYWLAPLQHHMLHVHTTTTTTTTTEKERHRQSADPTGHCLRATDYQLITTADQPKWSSKLITTAKLMMISWSTSHWLRDTVHHSWSTSHRLRDTDHHSWSTGHRLRDTDHHSWSTGHQLRDTDHRGWSTSHRLRDADQHS